MENPDGTSTSTSTSDPPQTANDPQEEDASPSKEGTDETMESSVNESMPAEKSSGDKPSEKENGDDGTEEEENDPKTEDVGDDDPSLAEAYSGSGPDEEQEEAGVGGPSKPLPEEISSTAPKEEEEDEDGSSSPTESAAAAATKPDPPSGAEIAPKSEPTTENAAAETETTNEIGTGAAFKEEGEERSAMDVDVESSEANDLQPPSVAEPKAETLENTNYKSSSIINNIHNSSNTTTYSTRGRSTESVDETIHVRDAFEESPRPKDPPSGVSFLVEGTEEERRTRTRFIPEVDGMHMLRKHEIKDDLALARSLPSIVSSSGVLQTRTGRLASGGGVGGGAGRTSSTSSNDSMEVDGEEINHVINDKNTTTVDLPSSSLTIPSDVFVAPKGVVPGDAELLVAVKDSEPAVPSPSKVESVTSFNPPRPPESVGGKKKHRMIRWERRPEDIEVDMKNYRKTVHRTRQELQKSESEFERLEMVDAHLRRHFLNQSDLLDEEYKKLNEEMEGEVEKLIKESELIGSRTRSRNLTKVDVVMRDVLTMLTRNEQKDSPMDDESSEVATSSSLLLGFGGLNAEAFDDWQRTTKLKSMRPSISWVEPGQYVKTPYGEGTVIEVIPPLSPDSNTSPKHNFESLLPLRVKVRLDYGVGVFAASSIVEMESPAHFTDAKLAKRWKGMIESALKVGPCIDLQGMLPSGDENGNEETKSMSGMSFDAEGVSNDDFLPVGASLIPTKGGRGNFLHNMKIRDIEESLQSVLYDGHGVLGRKSNPGVTKEIRKWEDEEQEYLNLRASILQLKNSLYRQRRIRALNERTTASMNDRYLRAEELVSEMRSDLKSLKRRLGDELSELGITDTMARQILFQFYQGHHEEDKGDVSTPRRLRRATSMIGEMLPDIDMGNDRGEGDPRDSMDDQGTDDLSGDDLESHRPAKKIRSGE